uniref:Uncharacterized protein n=1 Tax=Trichobilharzia regenti TaxID=157069 RepID=A0AA85JKI8_TRIRE|nr:unnamed protein product [Trichobilharzia regenti]
MEDKNDETVHTSHAPAVKAGGMRIVKHAREHEDKALTKSELAHQAAEYNSSITGVSPHDIFSKEELESHDKSVKASHDKPMPKVTKPHNDNTRRIIQQPSK